MKLSTLQKFILKSTASNRGKTRRATFLRYYERREKTVKPADRPGIVTRSIERLIDKGLMVGFGRRTPEKWFIDDVTLTIAGRRAVRKLVGKQQELPLGLRRKKVNK
ncbi:MAG: hypothetical protein PHY34_04155 [Patescibacteria group bacterium]|nr:hypothetical protein [Patescibacteria group bacterium]MDD5715338.1 hypothetical protein [Patescibacteria group bacterium]